MTNYEREPNALKQVGGERLRDYELILLLSPEADEQETTGAVERISHFIAERGGSVTKQEEWGLRKLAYPIKGFTEGKYVFTEFSAEPPLPGQLESTLKTSEGVLRHLLVRRAS